MFIASSCYAHARNYTAHYNITKATDAGLLDGECVSNNRDSVNLITHHAQHNESNYTSAAPGYSRTFLIKIGVEYKSHTTSGRAHLTKQQFILSWLICLFIGNIKVIRLIHQQSQQQN